MPSQEVANTWDGLQDGKYQLSHPQMRQGHFLSYRTDGLPSTRVPSTKLGMISRSQASLSVKAGVRGLAQVYQQLGKGRTQDFALDPPLTPFHCLPHSQERQDSHSGGVLL